MARKTDNNFLADAVGSRDRNISYTDGFRFGLGFMLAVLFITLILGGLTWAAIALLPWT